MADNFEIEGLELDIKADSKKAEQALDSLKARMEALKKSMSNSAITRISEQLTKLSDSMDKISKSLISIAEFDGFVEATEKLAQIKIPPSLAKQISNIGMAANSISIQAVTRLQMMSDALQGLKDVNAKISISDKVSKSIGKAAGGGLTDKRSESDATQEVEKSTEKVEKLGQATDNTNKKAEESISAWERVKSVLSGIKNVLGRVSSGMLSMGKATVKVTKHLLSFISKVTMVKSIGSKLASGVSTFTSKIGQLFAAIKRIAVYRLIRTFVKSITSGFKEGMENLYQYSLVMGTQFAPNMDRIATSLLYLKNSLGAITDPIVARLAPALDIAIDKFVDLLNIINQLISTLNGESTYTAAKKYGIAWQEAAEDTKQALDDIKRYVLGFDELNILGKKDSDKGSSDSNALDYSQMFEERNIDSSISSFVDRIKSSINKGEFEALGRQIGEYINAGINSIPDTAIGKNFGKFVNRINDFVYGLADSVNTRLLGKKIATNFNKAVSTINWKSLGRTIGTVANKILYFFDGLITNTDIGKLGASIGDYFASAVKTFDWPTLGRTVGTGITKISDFFGNLITNAKLGNLGSSIATFINKAVASTDWANIGADLAAGFNGIISFFSNLISKTDFKKIGASLGTFFTNAVKNTDWKDLGKTVANTFTGIADFVINFIQNTDFKEVGKAIGDTLKSALKSLNDWFGKQDFTAIGIDLGKGVSDFVKELDVLGIIKNLGLAIWNILKAAVELAFGFGIGIGERLVEAIEDVSWNDIKAFGAKIGDKIMDGISSTLGIDSFFPTMENAESIGKALGGDLLKAATILEKLAGGKKTVKNAAQAGAAAAVVAAQQPWAFKKQTSTSLPGSEAVNWGIQSLTNSSNVRKANTEKYAKNLANAFLSAFSKQIDNKKESIYQKIERYLEPGGGAGLTASIGTFDVTSTAKTGLVNQVMQIALKGVTQDIGVTSTATANLKQRVSAIALGGMLASINPEPAKGGVMSTVKRWGLDGTVSTIDPTSSALNNYYKEVKNYELTGTVTQIDFTASAQVALQSVFAGLGVASVFARANGGIFRHGIPMYAGGTTNAHGSLFMAGENGAEIVGNVNGQTEILNRSQMAAAMYTAAKAGMAEAAKTINSTLVQGANAVINAMTYSNTASTFNASLSAANGDAGSMSALIDGVREGVYEATAQQNELLRQQNEILLDLLAKDNTTEISTNSVVNSLALKNRRDGKYVVPVGVV